MQWRSWFRLLPRMARVEFLWPGAGPTASVRGGCHRPTATRRAERTADSDEQGQFRVAFVAHEPIDGAGRRSRETRRDAVRAIPLTVVAGVMFRCAAVADPVVTVASLLVGL